MASTSLSRTQTGTITNNKIATFSFWIKRSGISSYQDPFSADAGSDYAQIQFTNTDNLSIYQRDTTTTMQVVTSRVFRDVGAWYHIVVALDTTQATASDRVKIYVNGVQETSFGTSTYPAQNLVLRLNTASHAQAVGAYSTSSNYVDGSMTHVHQIDGTAYDASTFGESDANGVWKPKTSPSVTYGTNGFFLKFQNSGSMGTDSSGNGNNFTVNGTMTQTVDTPSNVYATLNPLTSTGVALSNGNLKVAPSGVDNNVRCTFGVNKGKWYWEAKSIGAAAGVLYSIVNENVLQTSNRADVAGIYGMQSNGYADSDGSRASTSFPAYTVNDIIQCALDCDNNKFYMGFNGTFYDLSGNTANPATGSNPTWTLNSNYNGLLWFPFYEMRVANESAEVNFGNGYFGTTAVASAGSNGNGAIFEYDVPSGYYALNTKNLATYG